MSVIRIVCSPSLTFGRARGPSSPSRNSSMGLIRASVSPREMTWMSPSRGTKRAPGMRAAISRPCWKGQALSPRRWRTSVGVVTWGSSGVISYSQAATVVPMAPSASAAWRWYSAKTSRASGGAPGMNTSSMAAPP